MESKHKKLFEELEAIMADRGKAYGSAKIQLDCLSDLWRAAIEGALEAQGSDFDRVFNAEFAGLLLVLMKISRIVCSKNYDHRDSYLDAINYLILTYGFVYPEETCSRRSEDEDEEEYGG